MRDLLERTLGPQFELRIAVAPDLPPAPVDANQIELAEAVRRSWPHMPILLATGYAEALTDAEIDRLLAPQAGRRGPVAPAGLSSAGC